MALSPLSCIVSSVLSRCRSTRKKSMSELLTERQLTIVMHLCNGLSQEDVDKIMYFSLATAARHLGASRRRVGAKSNIHLSSIVTASGQLYWKPDGRSTSPAQQPELVESELLPD